MRVDSRVVVHVAVQADAHVNVYLVVKAAAYVAVYVNLHMSFHMSLHHSTITLTGMTVPARQAAGFTPIWPALRPNQSRSAWCASCMPMHVVAHAQTGPELTRGLAKFGLAL